MQYTPAVLGFANGLQFRQWSSRGKEKIFFPQRTTKSSSLPRRDGSSPAVIVVLSASLQSSGRGGSKRRKVVFQMLGPRSKPPKKTHLTSLFSDFSCSSSFARPHWNVSISKFLFRILITLVQPYRILSGIPNFPRNELDEISGKDGQIPLSVSRNDEQSRSTGSITHHLTTIIDGDIGKQHLNSGVVRAEASA